jgi:hypothetical protein
MKLALKNIVDNPVNMLRRVGYTFQRREGGEMSFVRSFSASGYPRFHMYVKVQETDIIINIHFDSKKETYGEETRHHGEYENEGVLKEEVRRLQSLLED